MATIATLWTVLEPWVAASGSTSLKSFLALLRAARSAGAPVTLSRNNGNVEGSLSGSKWARPTNGARSCELPMMLETSSYLSEESERGRTIDEGGDSGYTRTS